MLSSWELAVWLRKLLAVGRAEGGPTVPSCELDLLFICDRPVGALAVVFV